MGADIVWDEAVWITGIKISTRVTWGRVAFGVCKICVVAVWDTGIKIHTRVTWGCVRFFCGGIVFVWEWGCVTFFWVGGVLGRVFLR